MRLSQDNNNSNESKTTTTTLSRNRPVETQMTQPISNYQRSYQPTNSLISSNSQERVKPTVSNSNTGLSVQVLNHTSIKVLTLKYLSNKQFMYVFVGYQRINEIAIIKTSCIVE